MDKDTSSNLPHPFGEAVARLIEEKNLKKYRIAKNMGKQVSEITRIEKQQGSPKWDTLFSLAQGMGINPRELFLKVCDIMDERRKTDS